MRGRPAMTDAGQARHDGRVTAGLSRSPGCVALPILAQVLPLRVEFHHERILPRALPVLQLLLAGNGDINIVVLLIPNELFTIVPCSKGVRVLMLLVFQYA